METPRIETLLRAPDESAPDFLARVEAVIARRESDGWALQTRQERDASVDLVFIHPPVT